MKKPQTHLFLSSSHSPKIALRKKNSRGTSLLPVAPLSNFLSLNIEAIPTKAISNTPSTFFLNLCAKQRFPSIWAQPDMYPLVAGYCVSPRPMCHGQAAQSRISMQRHSDEKEEEEEEEKEG